MDITKLVIDAERSIGRKPLLVNVAPYYEYKNNERTDKIQGYRYDVAMPDNNLDKIGVKIDGKQLVDKPKGYVEVKFTGLEMSIYWYNGKYNVKITATGIELVNKG